MSRRSLRQKAHLLMINPDAFFEQEAQAAWDDAARAHRLEKYTKHLPRWAKRLLRADRYVDPITTLQVSGNHATVQVSKVK